MSVVSELEICLKEGFPTRTTASIRGNRVTGNLGPGVRIMEDSEAVVCGCDLRGNTAGLFQVVAPAAVRADGNRE